MQIMADVRTNQPAGTDIPLSVSYNKFHVFNLTFLQAMHLLMDL